MKISIIAMNLDYSSQNKRQNYQKYSAGHEGPKKYLRDKNLIP